MKDETQIWLTPAISNDKILPNTEPPGTCEMETTVRACCGQYVPISFCVRSEKPLVGLIVEPWCRTADLDPDVKYVTCWWQAGDESHRKNKTTFSPELLLKDPAIVTVDMAAQRSTIRQPVQDAKELQPIYLKAYTTQQYWVTVRVPENGRGRHNLVLLINSCGRLLGTITVHIDVLPFELEPPELDYALYYRGQLDGSTEPQINADVKTPELYRAEMRNIAQHGVEYPTMYQGMYGKTVPETDARILEEIAIRKSEGIEVDPLYFCGGGENRAYKAPIETLEGVMVRVLERRILLLDQGIKELFFYGSDEARGNKLLEQREAWQAIQEVGGKVFVACRDEAIDFVGDILDVAVATPPSKATIEKWHANDKKIWLYGDPQTAPEHPEMFRRNYGLQLLADGWDGCCPYAYQSHKSDIWDDFDGTTEYRDLVLAYPTIDGVIDTIQWEGFREGITDVRYASTLKKLGGIVPGIECCNLDAIREEMIDMILSLT